MQRNARLMHKRKMPRSRSPDRSPFVPAMPPAEPDEAARVIEPRAAGLVQAVQPAEDPHGAPLAPEPFVVAHDRAVVAEASGEAARFVERVACPERQDVLKEVRAQPRGQRCALARPQCPEGGGAGRGGVGADRQHREAGCAAATRRRRRCWWTFTLARFAQWRCTRSVVPSIQSRSTISMRGCSGSAKS